MKHRVVLFVVLTSAIMLVAQPAIAANPNPEAFGLNAEPFGRSYERWAIRWSRWAFEAPADENPLVGHKNCEVGQSGSVWFLPVTFFPHRIFRCTIPVDTAILLTPAGTLCMEAFGNGDTANELRACAVRDGIHAVSRVRAALDGHPLAALRRYNLVTRMFQLENPPNGIFGLPPGPSKAVVAGFLLILKPLDPGTHRMSAVAVFDNGDRLRADYYLKIV